MAQAARIPRTCRQRKASCTAAAPLLLLALLAAAGARCFASLPVGRLGTRAQRSAVTVAAESKTESSGLAPAAATLSQPLWQRLLVDTAAMLTFPFRFLQLATITKEVVAAVTQEFKEASKSAEEPAKSKDGPKEESTAVTTLKSVIPKYMKTHVIARTNPKEYKHLLNTSLRLFVDAIADPYNFEPYHQAIRGPELDHYQWGNDFFRSMVKFRGSKMEGAEHVEEIENAVKAGDNVILLANHQTEADPQVLSLLLERSGHEPLAEQCIFVAGHKVTTDPMAIPFSMGRNLLTIYSKKYLDIDDEEEKAARNERNRLTMAEMQRLMGEGGNIFWVAPSGGRDRKTSPTGDFEPAAFDQKSVGLFNLLAQKASKKGGPKTRFFPLAMWTNRLVPPPDDSKAAVGESRSAARAPVGIEFGAEMDPEALGGRKKFPAKAEEQVRALYQHLDSRMTGR